VTPPSLADRCTGCGHARSVHQPECFAVDEADALCMSRCPCDGFDDIDIQDGDRRWPSATA
jgi:hypothetical protein